MNKTTIDKRWLSILLISMLLAGFMIGRMKETKVLRIKILDADQPLLARAMKYHSIEEAMIDSTGLIFFIRDSRWCSLYGIEFREMIAQEITEELNDTDN